MSGGRRVQESTEHDLAYSRGGFEGGMSRGVQLKLGAHRRVLGLSLFRLLPQCYCVLAIATDFNSVSFQGGYDMHEDHVIILVSFRLNRIVRH